MSIKLPSIRTVASRAGVSTATVSNVLNARRSVAPELVARVEQAVADLGYIADGSAARLRSRKSSVTGVMVPDIANPFYGAFVSVLEGAARHDGYDLLVVSSGGDPAQETARLKALITWRPAGIIVVPCDDTLAGRTIARAAGVPIVVADRIPADPDFDIIAVDNRQTAAAVTNHLLERGHRHMLVAAHSLAVSSVQERGTGIRDAAAKVPGALVEILEMGRSIQESRQRIAARLRQAPRPTALFTLNNLLTLGALGALTECRLKVPDDIALVGFDDEEWMHVVTPPLTAVRQPIQEMAHAAWGRLMARVDGDSSPPQQFRLPCTIEIRESTSRPREVPEPADLAVS
jgi:DNA-binding LacI/PurR family transcriptional regulator